MKENVQKEIIKNQKKLALTVLAVLIAGIFLEIFCNLPLFRANSGKNQGSFSVDISQTTYEGFHEDGGKLVFDGNGGKIRVPLSGRYVDKLCYSYEYEGLLNATVKVGVYNEYGGRQKQQEYKNFLDSCGKEGGVCGNLYFPGCS